MVNIVGYSVEQDEIYLHLETPVDLYKMVACKGYHFQEPLSCKLLVYINEQQAKSVVGKTLSGCIITTQKFLSSEEAWKRDLKFPTKNIYVHNNSELRPYEGMYGHIDINDID